MRRLFFTLATLSLTLVANALEVNNTAGALKSNISDLTTTTLTVTGTVDARDFKFIADELLELKTLDLSQAQIVAFTDSLKPLSGTTFSFPADELPAGILMGTDLTSIALPSTLQSIGNSALAGCTGITSITLPETLTSIGHYALSGSGIETIAIPATVTTIGEGAFAHCFALTSATLNTTAVPAYAFLGNTALNSVTLGNQVEIIGKSAFNGCTALQALNVDTDNAIKTIEAEAFIGANAQNIDLQALAQLASIGSWAFSGSNIADANLPAGVTTLGKGAFYYAQNLTGASLPTAIVDIPEYTFAGASALTASEMLAEGVTSIGDYAFFNNDNVSVFTIPASVNYIGAWAMAGMTGLDTLNVMSVTAPELGDSVWAGIDQRPIILNPVSNEAADNYEKAEQWKEFYVLRYYLMGDANNDMTVDIADINTLVARILEKPVDPFIFQSSDLNGDNEIDIADINAIINIILNDIEDYYRKVKARTPKAGVMTDDCVQINDFSIERGKTQTIELTLSNNDQYAGVQFDVELPEGLQIVPGSIKGTSRDAGYSFLLNNAGNRIIAFSPDDEAFTGNEGAIMSFKVKATDDFNCGSTISINNVVFSNSEHHRVVGNGSYAQVSTITGIDDMTATTDKVYAYGSTLVIESANGGVAQVVAMNGMAQEVNVEAGRSEIDLSTGFYVVRLNGNSYKVTIK